jgi:putative transposase
MPRKPRYFLPNVPVHIVQRGHSREAVFYEDQDYATYAHWLKESAKRYQLSIHAFVLMTNHVHLLVTPQQAQSVSLFMQFVGRRYVPYINFKYGRSGSIWEGRFKASLVQKAYYLLRVMRYIELNPVRANMVALSAQYRWSSFCHNVGIRTIELIHAHNIYKQLGKTQEERQTAYAELFKGYLGVDELKQIRAAWQTGTPLGSSQFIKQVERRLSTKVGQARPYK